MPSHLPHHQVIMLQSRADIRRLILSGSVGLPRCELFVTFITWALQCRNSTDSLYHQVRPTPIDVAIVCMGSRMHNKACASCQSLHDASLPFDSSASVCLG